MTAAQYPLGPSWPLSRSSQLSSQTTGNHGSSDHYKRQIYCCLNQTKVPPTPDIYSPPVVSSTSWTERLVADSLRDFTHVVYVWVFQGQRGGNLFSMSALFPWRLCSLSLSPHHLWCLATMRDRNHGAHHGSVCVWGVSLCVGVCMRGDQIYLMACHIWHGPRVKRPTGWDPYCADATLYTHTHPWSVPLLPSPSWQPSAATLWSSHCGSTQASISLISPSLSLLHFLCLSGSVSLPAAVWMAGPTALGCLGSGGIPISSSNHDIILPKWVKDVARIFPAFLFCSLPSNYIN